MRKFLVSINIILLLSVLIIFSSCAVPPNKLTDKTTVPSHEGPLILAHYMPWYRGPSTKAQESVLRNYGGHWTNWGILDSTQSDNGKAYIFSKHYPLTGPYDSGNTALLEYQAGLMKIAGIDGVIIDWLGSYAANDYGEIHEHTKAMVDVLERAGLKFTVCYEDNSLNMIKGKNGNDPAPVTEDSLAIGKISFDWAQANWFNKSAYIRYETRPLVLCFGPQHFDTKSSWDTVFSGVDPKPFFVDLDDKYKWADASYDWPPMGWSLGNPKVLSQERLIQYLDLFYSGVQKNKPYRFASVFSAFDDSYAVSYGYLDYADGSIFDLTWKKAIAFAPQVIQLVTWNDYGEGTIIEPTMERGYRELEYVQARIKEWNPSFAFTKEDLRWPLEFYKLRYTQTASAAQEAVIKNAIEALFEGNADVFRAEAAKTGAVVDMSNLKPLLRS